MQTIETNQAAWKRVKALVNALQMEKDYGCELSPYAVVLLNNLSTLVNEQVLKQKEVINEAQYQTMVDDYEDTLKLIWENMYWMLHTKGWLEEGNEASIVHLIDIVTSKEKWLKNYKRSINAKTTP